MRDASKNGCLGKGKIVLTYFAVMMPKYGWGFCERVGKPNWEADFSGSQGGGLAGI